MMEAQDRSEHHPMWCRWTECGSTSTEPCPYKKPDEAVPVVLNVCDHSPHGKHEWRQWYMELAIPSPPNLPSGYFCIFCTIRKP